MRTRTADSRPALNEACASPATIRHATAQQASQSACVSFRFVSFRSWQTASSQKENINRASSHSRRRQPAPLDSPLAGRLLKKQQVDDSAFFPRLRVISISCAVSAVAVISRVFLMPRDRVYPGEDIARERVALSVRTWL